MDVLEIFLLGCVVTVGQVPTRQAEAHDARVRRRVFLYTAKFAGLPEYGWTLTPHRNPSSAPPSDDILSKRDCARGVRLIRTEVLVHEDRQFGHHRDVGRHLDQP